MHIGLHFGKRKPNWTLRNKAQLSSALYWSRKSVVFSFYISIIQMTVLSPLLFWSLENYNFFLQRIEQSSPILVHIQNEKIWIIVLFAMMGLISLFSNMFVFKSLYTKFQSPNYQIDDQNFNDFSSSHSESDDQNRAS